MSSSTVAAGQLSDLTYGIEMEFLAYGPMNVNPQKALMKALRKPVLMECSKCAKTHAYLLPIEGNQTGSVSSYSVWASHNDCSLTTQGHETYHIPEGARFFQMELVSRKLNFTKPTPCVLGQVYPCSGEPFEWDSQVEIAVILERLKHQFSRPGYLAIPNKSCGLHVHVGTPDSTPPPVNVSLGIFAVFTALERQFDQILPVSRICARQIINGPVPGISRPHSAHIHDSDQNSWTGSGCRIFLEKIRETIQEHIEDDTETDRSTIMQQLKDNSSAPVWYDLMMSCDSVKDMMDLYPDFDSKNERINPRSLAVNLVNLYDSYGSKNTVEVRAGAGSLDPVEIVAWTDLVGKLTLWLSTPNIDHRTIVLDMWADPSSTIIDLAQHIGVTQSTMDFYIDRLSSDWAQRRHDRLTSDLEANPYQNLIKAIESNRLQDCLRENVESKIQSKLEIGLYGQLDDAVLRAKLPEELLSHPDTHTLSVGSCDHSSWADRIIANADADKPRDSIPKELIGWDIPPTKWSPRSEDDDPFNCGTAVADFFATDDFLRRPANPPNSPFDDGSLPPTPSRPAPFPSTISGLAKLINQNTADLQASNSDTSISVDSEWTNMTPSSRQLNIEPDTIPTFSKRDNHEPLPSSGESSEGSPA